MFWFFVIVLIIIVLYVYSVGFRLFIDKPIRFTSYIPKDLFFYFTRYKNIPKKPFINVYVGLFGSGKTLSAVHDVIEFYQTYNNKKVYDDRIKEYVTQKVFILSNVHLNGIPYRHFHSLQQLVNIGRWRHHTDKKKKQRTITIVLGDEFSVQMNSRSFKTNIDPLFLNALLTSRHALIHGFFLTSQRFEHLDALLRQVTSNVIECKKLWRIQRNDYYDAYQREHCSRPEDLKPIERSGWFVTDRDYQSYDTLAVVENLSKACSEGDMITEKEIRENIGQRETHGEKQKRKKR